MNKSCYIIILVILNFAANAQTNVEMADNFRGEGKVYVVVAVILTILIGIFYVLYRLDRRRKKIEEERTEHFEK